MRRYEQLQTAVDNALISEYKIGHTLYIVELHFNLDCKETVEDIIERLITEEIQQAA